MIRQRWSLENPFDAFSKITADDVICDAYLGSDDGLSIGWEFRKPEDCLAKAVLLYTMPTGRQVALCQDHAAR